MSKTLAQILAEISSQMPDNTTGAITPAIQRGVLTDITSSGRTFLNAMDYGAVGNGINDDSSAINTALTALSTAGGGTLYFPPGNYLMATSTLIPPSNSIIQGAGPGATTITNTSTAGGQDCVITVLMTMTSGTNAGLWPANNTTYPINAPTQGASSVTTTTAANAGNFAAGNIIMISGNLAGGNQTSPNTAFWFPSWYTTVVSANAGNGVITLAESLPLGGVQLTTVQKIVSLPKNIVVRDMTLAVNSNIGGFSGSIMEILGCERFLAENLEFVNVSGIQGAGIAIGAPVKYSGFRNCIARPVAGPIELFGATISFVEGCAAFNSAILIDGGSMDCTVINNHIKDPQENGAAFFGIYLPSYTLRNKVIGNSVTGISTDATHSGIGTVDTPDANRYHVVIGNTLEGAGTSQGVGIQMSKGVCVGNLLSNLATGIQLESISDGIYEGNYSDATVTTPLATFANDAGVFRTRQNPTYHSMASHTASPTVQGGQVYSLNQGGVSTNVTGFTGALPGDEITVVVTDGSANGTTFKNSATLQLKGNTDYNPAGATIPVVMCFVQTAGGGTPTWTEKSRSA